METPEEIIKHYKKQISKHKKDKDMLNVIKMDLQLNLDDVEDFVRDYEGLIELVDEYMDEDEK